MNGAWDRVLNAEQRVRSAAGIILADAEVTCYRVASYGVASGWEAVMIFGAARNRMVVIPLQAS